MQPKVILEKKKGVYPFTSSTVKIYRIGDILVEGKIVLMPDSVNKFLSKEKDKDKFVAIKYLQNIDFLNIPNFDKTETTENHKKKCLLFEYFNSKSRYYWNKKTKEELLNIYISKCKELDLQMLETIDFKYITKKKDLLELFLKNPYVYHIFGKQSTYFISNSLESNMEEGVNFSTYECVFNSIEENKEKNIAFVINYIKILKTQMQKNNLYRLMMFILQDGLDEIKQKEKPS